MFKYLISFFLLLTFLVVSYFNSLFKYESHKRKLIRWLGQAFILRNNSKSIVAIFLLMISCISLDSNDTTSPDSRARAIVGDNSKGTITRQVAEYNSIINKTVFDLILTSGKEGNLRIEGESNIIKHVLTEVKHDKLIISYPKNLWIKRFNQPLKIYIPIVVINSIENNGSGDIKVLNKIRTDKLSLKLRGSGDTELEFQAEELVLDLQGSGDITLSGDTDTSSINLKGSGDIIFSGDTDTLSINLKGSGSITLSGNADTLSINLKGSGDIKSYSLKSKVVKANLLGSGTINVNVKEILDVLISGSGDINYKGSPHEIKKSISGSGDINKIRL